MERGWAKRPAYPLRMQSRWQIVCVSDLILMDRSTSNQISLLSDSSADSALPQMNEIQVDQVMSCASKLTKLAANFPCPFFFPRLQRPRVPLCSSATKQLAVTQTLGRRRSWNRKKTSVPLPPWLAPLASGGWKMSQPPKANRRQDY